eukprot:jgi/Chlat1/552/Chrsp103S01130
MATAMLDFRGLDEGVGGGKKRKRKEEERAEAAKGAPSPMECAEAIGWDAPANKRARAEEPNVGRLSKRRWKAGAPSRASAKQSVPSLQSSWEQKMAQKASKKQFQERVKEIKEAANSVKREKRLRMEAAKKRKEENSLKSAIYQKVSNPKTLKKMSKKERQKLVKMRMPSLILLSLDSQQ